MRTVFALSVAAFVLSLGVAGSSAAGESESSSLEWAELPPLPDSLGVAGPFVGTSGGALIVAGGANFPDGPPWEGHKKVFHDRIYVLEKPDGTWRVAEQKLPRPLAYGVSVTTPEGILCIGGADADRHYGDVLLIRLLGDRIELGALPPLPAPAAYACGTMLGTTVYVAGGTEAPSSTSALHTFRAMDLSRPTSERKWEALEPWPGPERFLAVAAAQDSAVFVIGGVQLRADEKGAPQRVKPYLRDTYRYTPGKSGRPGTWQRLADVPQAVAAAPSPAVSVGPSHVMVLGGDDGSFAGQDPGAHPGFAGDILAYHTITNSWTTFGKMPQAAGEVGSRTTVRPVVTTATAWWRGRLVVASGEVRPGVRTPQVLAAKLVERRADFGWLNYAALAAYLAAMVGIGLWFSGRKSTNDFFRAGQRIPWWAAGLSIYATMLSSITYMAIPAKTYATDWTYLLNYAGILLVAPLVIYAYLPFFRGLDVTSAYEYLERRFNLPVRLLGSASFILLQVGRIAIVLYLPAIALATIVSFDVYACIIIMGVLCILYAVVGGIEAVVWTDVVQAVILVGGVVLSLALIVMKCDGGLGGAVQLAAADHKVFQNTPWTWDTTQATAWIILAGALFSAMVPYTSSQDVVQRYVTTKDSRLAAKSIWANAVVSVLSGTLFFALGTGLYAFYKSHPQHLEPALPTDAIFPLFIVRELPAGIGGLIIAGIFAAAQSTLASSLNSVATCYVTDFHRRLLPPRSDRAYLRLAQWITGVVGVTGTGVACLMAASNIASLWDSFIAILGLFGAGLAGLFALGIFTRRASGSGALVGALASAGVLFCVQRYTATTFFLYPIIGIGTCFVVGYAASLALRSKPKDLRRLTVYTRNA